MSSWLWPVAWWRAHDAHSSRICKKSNEETCHEKVVVLDGVDRCKHCERTATSTFKDADLNAGEKLIAENQCNECHIRRVGGDGSAIYKPKGRINTAGALRGMVEYCNTELNLGFSLKIPMQLPLS